MCRSSAKADDPVSSARRSCRDPTSGHRTPTMPERLIAVADRIDRLDRGDRPRGGVVLPVHRAGAVRRGGAALRVRHRLDLAAGIDHLRPRDAVHAGRGLDAAGRRPCARRHLLCRRVAAHQGDGRSARRAALSAALRARARSAVRAALRGALLGDPGALARDQRTAVRLSAQDADSRCSRSCWRCRASRRRSAPRRARRAAAAGSSRAEPWGETLAVTMVVAVCALLLAGYPVALTLGGVSLAFAVAGHLRRA